MGKVECVWGGWGTQSDKVSVAGWGSGGRVTVSLGGDSGGRVTVSLGGERLMVLLGGTVEGD